MEVIKIDDIGISSSDPYPCFVSIEQNGNRIHFGHKKVQIIIDALKHTKKEIRTKLSESEKLEV